MATEVTQAVATSMGWRTMASREAKPAIPPAPINCRSTVALRFLVLHASDEPPSPWPWSIARGNGAISDRETFIRGDVQIKTNVRPSLPLHDAVLSAPLDAAPCRRS
jgi:hypothetical protein